MSFVVSALVTVFVAMTCAQIPVEKLDVTQYDALDAVYNSLGCVNDPNNCPRSTADLVCGLARSPIKCANRSVVELNLAEKGLGGILPVAIARLTALTRLVLNNNSIEQWPLEVFTLGNLETLLLGNNPFFLGELQAVDFSRVTKLKNFQMQGANLAGTLPSSLTSLTSINILNLAHNNLNGSVIDRLPQTPTFEELYLQNNLFTGSGPSLQATFKDVDVRFNLFTGASPNTSKLPLVIKCNLQVANDTNCFDCTGNDAKKCACDGIATCPVASPRSSAPAPTTAAIDSTNAQTTSTSTTSSGSSLTSSESTFTASSVVDLSVNVNPSSLDVGAPQATKWNAGSGPDIALIGGIVGGIVVLLLLIGIIVFFVRRRRSSSSRSPTTPATTGNQYGDYGRISIPIPESSMYNDVADVRHTKN